MVWLCCRSSGFGCHQTGFIRNFKETYQSHQNVGMEQTEDLQLGTRQGIGQNGWCEGNVRQVKSDENQKD